MPSRLPGGRGLQQTGSRTLPVRLAGSATLASTLAINTASPAVSTTSQWLRDSCSMPLRSLPGYLVAGYQE